MGAGDGAQGRGEDLGRDDPGQPVGTEGPCRSENHNHGCRGLAARDGGVRHWDIGARLSDRDVGSEVVLAESAAERRYNPWPLAAEGIDEPGEEDDRTDGLDYAVDTGPEGNISEADRSKDGRGVV